MKTNYHGRIAKLKARMSEIGVDLAVITGWDDLRYFGGLEPHPGRTRKMPSMALLIPVQGPTIFITTQGFSHSMQTEHPDIEFVAFSEDQEIAPYRSRRQAIQQAVTNLGTTVHTVGIEPNYLTKASFEQLSSVLVAEFVDIEPIVFSLRAVKDEIELDLFRQACAVTDKVYADVVMDGQVREGMSEIEVEFALLVKMVEYGAYPKSVQVFSGPRCRFQSIIPAERRIEHGDVVLLDIGVRLENYTSDITRAVVVGPASAEQLRVHEVVKKALHESIACVKPDVEVGEIDRIVQEIFRVEGFEEFYVHRAGHGLGLDSTDLPIISVVNRTLLESGMCIAIEPGIYLKDFGIRLEDNVIVTPEENEVVTKASLNLLQV